MPMAMYMCRGKRDTFGSQFSPLPSGIWGSNSSCLGWQLLSTELSSQAPNKAF